MGETTLAVEELLQTIKKQERKISSLQKKIDSFANFEFFTRETSDFICISDPDKYLRKFSSAFVKKLGYTKKELFRNTFDNFIYHEDFDTTNQAMLELLKTKVPVIYENRIVTKNKELLSVQWTSIITPTDNFVYSIGRDISDLRKIQEKLIASEKLLNEAQKIAKIGSWEFNVKTKELTWSQELHRIFEIPIDNPDTLYAKYLSRFSEEGRNLLQSKIAESFQTKQPYEIEHKLVLPDNRLKWVFGTGVPITDDKGAVVFLRGVAQDITEKKRIELEIVNKEKEVEQIKEKEREQKSNAKFRNYIDNAPDGVMVLDSEGHFLEINPAVTKITGYSKKKLLRKTFWDLIPTASISKIKSMFSTLLSNQASNEVSQFIAKKASLRDWSIDAVKLADNQILLFVRDITERIQTLEALKEKERFLRETQDIAQLGTYTIDMPSGKWYRTQILNSILGIDPSFDLNRRNWFNLVHPDCRYDLKKYFTEEVLKKGKAFNREYKIIRNDDQTERWVHGIGALKRDKEGKARVMVGTIRDITERKQLELALIQAKEIAEENEKDLYVKYTEYEEINQELKQTNRELKIAKIQADEANKAKSDFLSNMSHEIRTPLNGIVGFTDLLMKTKMDKNQLEYMSTINISANALMEIINDILDFSKIESGKLELHIEEIDLFQLLNQVIDLFKQQAILKNISLSLQIGEDVPQFMEADSIRLKQILVNLISNALKFTAVGQIHLDVKRIKDLRENVKIQFSIKDTGIGIKQNNQKKIFNSFVQEESATSKKFGGTGLGLAISNLLLELMNSKLQLKSKYGLGSNFYFAIKFKKVKQPLNIVIETEMQKESIDLVQENYGQVFHILIVEDNKINMFLTKTLVKRIVPNAIIFEAINGDMAIAQFKEIQADLILMDIQMPVKSGYEASMEIRGQEGGDKIPIIALTAGIMAGEKDKCLENGMNDYISKPIIEGDLVAILTKWLPDKQPTIKE